MENYNIKRNPKKLSEEDINRHKDFGKLLNNQKKLYRYRDGTKPLYRNIGFMSMMIVVGVVLLVLVIDLNEGPTEKTAADSLVVKADTGLQLVQEPNPVVPDARKGESSETTGSEKPITTEQAAIVYELFKVNPEKSGVCYTSGGARLLVPALAFSDKKNVLVRKEILLKYRELQSVKEAGGEIDSDVKPFKLVELLAVESKSNKTVLLTKPIVMEMIASLNDRAGTISFYTKEKKKWEYEGNETVSYRFMLQSNDTHFPELTYLKTVAWEFPGTSNPAEFTYIFNKPWKGFSFKTSDKKELSVKNASTSFTGLLDIAPILGDPALDQELKEAFYAVYNLSKGKTVDEEPQKQAIAVLENWKNSAEGKAYQKWLTSENSEKQFYSAVKVSKMPIVKMGIHSVSYTSNSTVQSKGSKRILSFEKGPEQVKPYNQDMNQY